MKLKIVVSHPDRQYANSLLQALEQRGWLQRFYTTLAANRLPGWMRSLLGRWEKELKKRTFYHIPPERIQHRPLLLALVKGLRVSYFTRLHLIYRWFDRWVANQLDRERPDIVLTYENANRLTMARAKALGMITVLDLAQIHHDAIARIEEQYYDHPTFPKEEVRQIDAAKASALANTDYILTLSSFAAQTLYEAGWEPNRVFEVNLGVDTERFFPKESYRQEGVFRLLFVGTIMRRKGIHILLRAWTELNLPEAELMIIGPMADGRTILEQEWKTFTYQPFLHHEELAEEFRQADVFVFPSLLDSWAQTVVEAMACGTPAIVTEHTGSKDAVRQGGGFVIPPADVTALKEKIQYLYDHREKVAQLGLAAHRIAQQYTWPNYQQQVVKALTTIAEKEGLKS